MGGSLERKWKKMNLKGKKSFETSCSGWSRALEMCTVFLGTRGRAGLAQARGGPSHTCSLSSVGRGCHQACWLGLPSVFPEGEAGPGDSQFAQVTWSVVEQSSNLSLSLGGPLDSCVRSPAPSLLSPHSSPGAGLCSASSVPGLRKGKGQLCSPVPTLRFLNACPCSRAGPSVVPGRGRLQGASA